MPDKQKLPRQAKLIAAYAILNEDAGPAELVPHLRGRLDTKQPIGRVIRYYWPRLVKHGLVKPAEAYVSKPASTADRE